MMLPIVVSMTSQNSARAKTRHHDVLPALATLFMR